MHRSCSSAGPLCATRSNPGGATTDTDIRWWWPFEMRSAPPDRAYAHPDRAWPAADQQRDALAHWSARVIGEAIDATDGASVAEACVRRGEFQHLMISIGGSSAIGPYVSLSEAALRKTFEGQVLVVPARDPRGQCSSEGRGRDHVGHRGRRCQRRVCMQRSAR